MLTLDPVDLVMEIPKEHEKKVLTKFFVFLRFNTFHNTIRAMTILDNLEYNVQPFASSCSYTWV